MNKFVVVVVLLISLIQWCDAGANAPISNQFVFSAGANFDNVIKEGEEAIINLFQRLVYSRDGRWDNGLAKRDESEEEHQLEERAYVYKCASNQPITSVNGSFLFRNNTQLLSRYFNIPANTVLIGQSGSGSCNKWESNLTGNVKLPGYFADGPKLDSVSIVLTWGTFASKQWYYQQKATWNITILNVEPTLDCSKVTVTGSSSNYNIQVAFSDPAGIYDAPYAVHTNWGDASFNTNVGAGALVPSTTTSFQDSFSNSYSGSSGGFLIYVTDKDGGQSNVCQVQIKDTTGPQPATTRDLPTPPVTTGEVTSEEVPVTTSEITTEEIPITTGDITTGEVTSAAVSTGPITTKAIPITTKDLTTKVGITTKKAITTKNITTKNITTKNLTTKNITTRKRRN